MKKQARHSCSAKAEEISAVKGHSVEDQSVDQSFWLDSANQLVFAAHPSLLSHVTPVAPTGTGVDHDLPVREERSADVNQDV